MNKKIVFIMILFLLLLCGINCILKANSEKQEQQLMIVNSNSIEKEINDIEIKVGDTVKLCAKCVGLKENTILWENSNIDVATLEIFESLPIAGADNESDTPSYHIIQKKAKIIALKPGTTIITAKVGDTIVKCNITVVEGTNYKNLEEVTINNKKCLQNFNLEDNTASKIINSAIEILGKNYNVKIYRNGTEIKGNTRVGTGNIIKVINGENIEKEYTTLIYGDINGDGQVDAIDALIVIKNKLRVLEIPLADEYLEAGRVNVLSREAKSIPSSLDALSIVKYKLMPSQYPIQQKMNVKLNSEI